MNILPASAIGHEITPIEHQNQNLLCVGDVAIRLGVPRSWVYERTRRRGRGRLPHLKVGKYVRFRAEDIDRYLEALRRA